MIAAATNHCSRGLMSCAVLAVLMLVLVVIPAVVVMVQNRRQHD